MRTWKMLVRLPGFQAALTVLSLVLFGWPVITILEKAHDTGLFFYLYLVWGFLIVVLYLTARHLAPSSSLRDEDSKTGPEDRLDV